jgi:hypothetical protein
MFLPPRGVYLLTATVEASQFDASEREGCVAGKACLDLIHRDLIGFKIKLNVKELILGDREAELQLTPS